MTFVWAGVSVFAVAVLNFSFCHAGSVPVGDGFVVANPGPGRTAPALRLDSTVGPVSLADYKGRSVLLYFQEGIGCQPCWDQIRDLEWNRTGLKAVGVDELLSVTTGPLDLVDQKTRDDGFTMMDGHTFVLVGPDGKILWRADYGVPRVHDVRARRPGPRRDREGHRPDGPSRVTARRPPVPRPGR